MPHVTLAPSVRKAFRRLTAKDPRRIDLDRGKYLLEEAKLHTMAISANLCEGPGKFWIDSDSDCDDLGDAEALAQATKQCPWPVACDPPTQGRAGVPSSPGSGSTLEEDVEGAFTP